MTCAEVGGEAGARREGRPWQLEWAEESQHRGIALVPELGRLDFVCSSVEFDSRVLGFPMSSTH